MTDDNGQIPTPTPNPAPITTNPPGSIAWAEKYLTDTTIDAVDRPLDPDRDFGTDAIAIVEQHLRALGYLDPNNSLPGIAPVDIEQAVKQFQVDVGLPEPFHGYGRIGPRTLSWLEIHAAILAYDGPDLPGAEDEEPAPAPAVEAPKVEAPTVADTAPMAPAVATEQWEDKRTTFKGALWATFCLVLLVYVFAKDVLGHTPTTLYGIEIPSHMISIFLAAQFVIREIRDVLRSWTEYLKNLSDDLQAALTILEKKDR